MLPSKPSRDIMLRPTSHQLPTSHGSMTSISSPVRSFVSNVRSNPSSPDGYQSPASRQSSTVVTSGNDINHELSPDNPLFSFLSASQQTPHLNLAPAVPAPAHPPLTYSKSVPLTGASYPLPPPHLHTESLHSPYQTMHWNNLQFKSPQTEKAFREHLSKSIAPSFLSFYGLIIMNVCVLAMVGLTLASPAYFFDDDSNVYIQRLGLFAAGSLIIFISTGVILHHICFGKTLPRCPLAIALTIAGMTWAIAGVLHNDDLENPSTVHYMIVFLIYLHVTSYPLLFFYIAPSSTAICLTYIMCTIIERYDSELWINTITNYGFLAVAHFLLNYYLYVNEQLHRQTFAFKVYSDSQSRVTKQEVDDLRHKVYTLVLEKYDIADLMKPNVDHLEFKKQEQDPLELVMCMLAKMKSDVPKKTSQRIDECLTLCSQARR